MSNARLCATKYNTRRLDEVDSRESPKRSNCGPDTGMNPLPAGCNQEATPVLTCTMRLILTILSSVVLAGCASTSDVTATENGHLAVSARGNLSAEFVSWASVKDTAMDRAKIYCSDRGKQIRELGTSSDGMMGISGDKVTVIFDCA